MRRCSIRLKSGGAFWCASCSSVARLGRLRTCNIRCSRLSTTTTARWPNRLNGPIRARRSLSEPWCYLGQRVLVWRSVGGSFPASPHVDRPPVGQLSLKRHCVDGPACAFEQKVTVLTSPRRSPIGRWVASLFL